MLQNDTTRQKIDVYTANFVKDWYKEVTGEELGSYTLTRLVKKGLIRKVTRTMPGKKTQSYYMREDIDRWIEQIKQDNDTIHVVA
jgi:hypothetical protein